MPRLLPHYPAMRWSAARAIVALLAMFPAIVARGAVYSAEKATIRSDGARLLPVRLARGSLQNPCYAAGGTELVLTWFTQGYNAGGAGLWLVKASDGTLVQRLTDAADTSVNMPGRCFDPASKHVVFSSDPAGPDEAFLIPLTGGRPQPVTTSPQIAWEPTFSRDGKWIAFESHHNGAKGEIWKVQVTRTGLTRLSSGSDDRQPSWGPNGLIAFQRHSGGQVDLMVMKADGSGERRLTSTPGLEETDVGWSPSGNWLVFSSDGPNVAVASLFTIRLDGRGRRRLTTAPRYDGAPAWSPDGRTIAFESAPGDPEGGPGTRIWTIAAPAGRH